MAGDEEAHILRQCHNGPSGGHHGIATTVRKVFEAGFTGHISFEMHVSWYKFAMHVNEQETSHQGMKHLRNKSKFVKYSMFGELTLWDLSPHQTETNTSCTWMAFGGNTHDLGSFGEETDEITDLHQIHEEILFSERGDGVAGIKRHRRDPSSDGVRHLTTTSRHGLLKEDLESST
nr:hypothetical protein [Tanacetum cinerariifolium]